MTVDELEDAPIDRLGGPATLLAHSAAPATLVCDPMRAKSSLAEWDTA